MKLSLYKEANGTIVRPDQRKRSQTVKLVKFVCQISPLSWRGGGLNHRKGFTLLELIAVLAVIAILAAVLTPVIGRYIDDARRSTAFKDVRNLAAAITMFYKDVGSYPGWQSSLTTDAGTPFVLLMSVATSLADEPKSQGSGMNNWLHTSASSEDEMDDHLLKNTPGYRTSGRFVWRGPYQQDYKEDPWGNYYAYNSKFINPANSSNALIVLSAGPDEEMDTPWWVTGGYRADCKARNLLYWPGRLWYYANCVTQLA